VPAISLGAADAIELAELLEFINGWLRSDRGNLAAALARFAGSAAYRPDALRDDFARSGSSSASPTARDPAASRRVSAPGSRGGGD
jgi:hypothetical protein